MHSWEMVALTTSGNRVDTLHRLKMTALGVTGTLITTDQDREYWVVLAIVMHNLYNSVVICQCHQLSSYLNRVCAGQSSDSERARDQWQSAAVTL